MKQHPNATAAGLSTGLAGACTTLALYIATTLGWNPPPEVSAAIVTLVAAVVSVAVLRSPGPKQTVAPRKPTKLRKDKAAPHSTK